jgi:lipid-A-disaccharide synthase
MVQDRGVDHVEFVGHPLSGEVKARFGREEFCRRNDLDPRDRSSLFCPAAGDKELQRILPPMLDAIEQLRVQRPEFKLSWWSRRADRSQRHGDHVATRLGKRSSFVEQQTREALAASDAAAIASGTATLEAALLETPMVVVYKESAVNWHTLGRLITSASFWMLW